MTRDIIITFVSNIPDDVVYHANDLQHGKFQKNGNPAPTLFGTSNPRYSSSGQQVASLHKTTSSSYGVTGNITYQLPNNQGDLVFMFNNPYTQNGSGDPGNCWLYAAITNIPANSTTTYYALVTGIDMQPDPPFKEDTMKVTVTLYLA